ncbi:MAG: cytochrome P450 [Myxococcota bacterium]
MIYDPYSRKMQEDPYPIYREFRDQLPCAYNEKMDFYALFRFEDVWKATLDWETYSSSLGPMLENRGQIPSEAFSIIGLDPPAHTRLRNLISRGFTPRRIGALEREMRDIARGYLDALSDQSDFDIQREFSVKLPMDVISALLGIPPEYRDRYREWVDRGLERDPDTGLPSQQGISGMQQARALILDLLAQRRADPHEDLISLLANADLEEPDRAPRRLTDAEVGGFCGLLAAAGAETTAKLIGNAVVYLGRDPAQRKLLFEDPGRIPLAIEELLRYDAPSQFQGRVVLRDVTVGGVTIPKGARVALVTGAACRDEREFDDPDRLDLSRRVRREIYFGYGQHFCIGKSLARLEARIALEEIAARFPDYEVNEAGLKRTYQAHVRGFKNVPIRV